MEIFICLLLPCACLCLCARWELVVQRSASPCQPVMYGSDLWAGGNGKYGRVWLELSVGINWGVRVNQLTEALAPRNPQWKTNNGMSGKAFANIR